LAAAAHAFAPQSAAPAPERWTLRQPLLGAALSFALGTCFSQFANTAARWTPPNWELIGAIFAAAAAVPCLLRSPRLASTLALVSISMLGAAQFQFGNISPAFPPELENREVVVIGKVLRSSLPVLEASVAHNPWQAAHPERYQQLDLQTVSVFDGSKEIPLHIGVRIGLYQVLSVAEEDELTSDLAAENKPAREFSYGQFLKITGRLRSPQNYEDPGAWDRRKYLRDQGIVALLTAKPANIEVLPIMGGTRWGRWRWQARRSLLRHVLVLHNSAQPRWQALAISQTDATLLAAMIMGERSLLDRGVKLDFQKTGSYHLLVISGMAVAILAFAVFWLARLLRLGDAPATILTIVFIGVYVALTDLGAPVQRAALMCGVYLLARLLYRERNPLNAIGAAALVVLVIDPKSLFDAGFQMTFLAVLTIAGVAVPVLERTTATYRKALKQIDSISYDIHLAPSQAQFRLDLRMVLSRLETFVPKWAARLVVLGAFRMIVAAAEIIFISLLMQAALALPMAVYFHRATTLALPANVVVVPLMTVLLPLGIGTTLLTYAGAWIAFLPRCVTALLLHSVSANVFTLAHFRASDLRVADPPLWTAIFCMVSLALAIIVARKHWVLVAVSLLLLAAADVFILRPRPPQIVANALEITAIDVGQGDSLLVVTPQGRTLLIDGGGTLGTPTSFDTGEDVVSPYLWARGFSHLDAVALTHAHGDHIGGLPSILNNFHPAELWVAPSPLTGAYTALLAQAHAQSMTVSTRVAGDSFTFGGAKFEVLAPAADSISNIRRGNDESMVLKVSYRDTSALLEGDAEKKTERLIAPELTPVNILKVAHHGSATSTIPALLESAHPQFAMISVGRFNRYGHPRDEVLSRLSEAGTCVFRTDLSGAISFYLDGTRVTAARWGRDGATMQFPSRWIPRQTAGHCAAAQ